MVFFPSLPFHLVVQVLLVVPIDSLFVNKEKNPPWKVQHRKKCSLHSVGDVAAGIPIDPNGWPEKFPAKEHCSRCGLCETTFVSQVKDACAFLGPCMSRIDGMEVKVHGRTRKVDSLVWSSPSPFADESRNGAENIADEGRFGVLHEPVRLAIGVGIQDAQWTGAVTGIALAMLESGSVDAVVCIASSSSSIANDNDNDSSWCTPEPIVARTVEHVLRGRGVKPALAPSLAVLDEIRADPSIRRLLFCGVGCAVQAFRSVQDGLTGLEEIYVLGTNCADNSPTPQAAETFVRQGVRVAPDQTIRGYEFMQDFRVHVKTQDDYITMPYFCLPGNIAEQSIAKSCLACFDYTNALADVVVGYMGAPLDATGRMDQTDQTLTVRNEKGAAMVQTAVRAGRLRLGSLATGRGSHETISAATVRSDQLVQSMVSAGSKSSEQAGMPLWIGEAMGFAMRTVGPKGVNFARYSIDYHTLRNYFYVLSTWGEAEAASTLPRYAREIVARYLQSDKVMEKLRVQITSTKDEK